MHPWWSGNLRLPSLRLTAIDEWGSCDERGIPVIQIISSGNIVPIALICCKLNYPTCLPSSHPTSNLTRKQNCSQKFLRRRHKVLPPSVALFWGCQLFIGLRFYARHAKKAPRKMDDWATLPCLVSALCLEDCICQKGV